MLNVTQTQAANQYAKTMNAERNSSVSQASFAISVTRADTTDKPSETAIDAKQQMNASILQSSLEASISSGNEPLALLYRAAIEKINEILEPELGANAIEKGHESELDVSPKATADRIVSQATSSFGAYQKIHPELSNDQAAEKFAAIISGGIDQGFAEAKEILDGLNVLEGDIASNIDETYELVQKGIQSFIERFSEDAELTER